MNTRFGAAIMVGCLSLAGHSWAQQPQHGLTQTQHLPVMGQITLQSPKRTISVFSLGEVTSSPGESLPEFLKRAGGKMSAWSAQTGFEACANICKNAKGRLGLSVTTNQSHVVCVIVDHCPKGFEALTVRETVHTHPKQKSTTYTVSVTDKKFLLGERKLGEKVPFGDAEEFSPEDVSGVSGYLITGEGKLRYWSDATGIIDYGLVTNGGQGVFGPGSKATTQHPW